MTKSPNIPPGTNKTFSPSWRTIISILQISARGRPGKRQLETILGRSVAKWLSYYATNRRVAGSIPDGVTGIFQWCNPSGRTMALGSTHSVTKMSTRCISWVKGSRCIKLTTLQPTCAIVMKSGNLNFLEPSGPLQARNGTALPFNFTHYTRTIPYFRIKLLISIDQT